MQHLDEGTIHSWLDGALGADEAAPVEAHVKECPQCASAVAEARGFIAASSRILTALDHAPRGVVPIAAPRSRVDPLVWRVAATVLVVAAGTLVVVRTRGADEQLMSAKAERVTFSSQPTAVTEQAPAAADQATAPANRASAKPAVSNPPVIALSKRAGNESSRSSAGVRENKTATQGLTATTGQTTAAPSRVNAIAAVDAAAEVDPLRVVGTPRRIGAKITLYEVAPGDTVTLTESVPLSFQQVVVTGGAVAPMARRATEKSAAALPRARADAAITAAPDSQRAAGAALSAPTVSAPAPSQQDVANAIHTIMWTDPTTGNTLSLTGRLPEARLQEVRIRIDRERAAAAKKIP